MNAAKPTTDDLVTIASLTDAAENHPVIDRAGLVTFLRCALGENSHWPFDRQPLLFRLYKRRARHTDLRCHGFDDRSALGGFTGQHGDGPYHSTNWYHCISEEARKAEAPDSVSGIREIMKKMPGSDEPAYYVKIKEGMYLVSVTEQNMEKILGDKIGFRSDTLCFLDNWNRMYSVGRGFGTMTTDGKDSPIFVMIGKYAVPEDVDAHFFTDPNPYLV